MFLNKNAIVVLLVILISLVACKDKNDDYSIPTSYNFENVDHSGQTERLNMLSEMKAYMATAKIQNTALDVEKLKSMYANINDAFSSDYEKELKNKTFESEQDKIEVLIEELAFASESAVNGELNQTGIIVSTDGSKSYLIGSDGLDHAQLIEKGLMGACFYYQATSVYLGTGKMDVDNDSITTGKGTTMEHHWDEAFGYLGVSKEFPTNTNDVSFWGKYTNTVDPILNSNQTIMDAFLKGRTAIVNDDMDVRDEAISEIRSIWELIVVGSALHYLNEGIAQYNDPAIRLHALSEATGFIYSLRFNEEKIATNTEIDGWLIGLTDADTFEDMNLYQAETEEIKDVIVDLALTYNLTENQFNF